MISMEESDQNNNNNDDDFCLFLTTFLELEVLTEKKNLIKRKI